MLAAFRPTLPKVILAVALFALSYVVQSSWWNAHFADYWAYGFPFPFQESWGPCPPGEICRDFNTLALFADAGVWYVVAVAIARGVSAFGGEPTG